MRILFALALTLAAVGCGDDSSKKKPVDMAMRNCLNAPAQGALCDETVNLPCTDLEGFLCSCECNSRWICGLTIACDAGVPKHDMVHGGGGGAHDMSAAVDQTLPQDAEPPTD